MANYPLPFFRLVCDANLAILLYKTCKQGKEAMQKSMSYRRFVKAFFRGGAVSVAAGLATVSPVVAKHSSQPVDIRFEAASFAERLSAVRSAVSACERSGAVGGFKVVAQGFTNK